MSEVRIEELLEAGEAVVQEAEAGVVGQQEGGAEEVASVIRTAKELVFPFVVGQTHDVLAQGQGQKQESS